MKKQSLKALAIPLTLSVLFLASASLAATFNNVLDFPEENVTAKLFKNNGKIFSFVSSSATLQVYRSNNGTTWTEVTESLGGSTPFVEQMQSMGPAAVWKARDKKFIAFQNTDGVAEIWQVNETGGWSQSGEDGLTGDTGNTAVTAIKRLGSPRQLYAFTENTEGVGVFTSVYGNDWEQVGEYGLGIDATSVIGLIEKQEVPEETSHPDIYIGTDTGYIYQTEFPDLGSWTVVATVGDEVTTMKKHDDLLYIGVIDEGVSKVLVSTDTNWDSFEQLGEDGLGDANNSTITRIQSVPKNGGTLYALTENETQGAQMYTLDEETNTWTLFGDDGLGNSDNTSLDRILRFRGKRYISTTNATTGAEVYRWEE